MKRGRKPIPMANKVARGTYRTGRDGHAIEIIATTDPPQPPDYLTNAALAVWVEEVGRAEAAGAVETDSSLFGRYCSLEAVVRQMFASGESVPAAHLAELRRHSELLGLAGPRSRIIRTDQTRKNSFALLRESGGKDD